MVDVDAQLEHVDRLPVSRAVRNWSLLGSTRRAETAAIESDVDEISSFCPVGLRWSLLYDMDIVASVQENWKWTAVFEPEGLLASTGNRIRYGISDHSRVVFLPQSARLNDRV